MMSPEATALPSKLTPAFVQSSLETEFVHTLVHAMIAFVELFNEPFAILRSAQAGLIKGATHVNTIAQSKSSNRAGRTSVDRTDPLEGTTSVQQGKRQAYDRGTFVHRGVISLCIV